MHALSQPCQAGSVLGVERHIQTMASALHAKSLLHA
jgi:hypothetical protein